jgi:YD repeat-containing protein
VTAEAVTGAGVVGTKNISTTYDALGRVTEINVREGQAPFSFMMAGDLPATATSRAEGAKAGASRSVNSTARLGKRGGSLSSAGSISTKH